MYSFLTPGRVERAMTYEHLDARLINSLLRNGRSSLRSLAEELDVSVTTVSNHLADLEEDGVIDGYVPVVDYEQLGYDVTAVVQLKVEGTALPDITDRLASHKQMISVYEVTGGYDIVAIGKFRDTDGMNDQIKALLTDPEVKETNTSVVLDAPVEYRQFELEADE
jgi:DNA-binding Lrp family transcriptional regulator